MKELPRGTVTFLFTDIEGSTKLWQQFPVAMRDALARHHQLLTESIERHNGYVFQIIGDAFCAAFSTAFEGLDAALESQRALRDAKWGETGAIKVRMALHTGAAEVRAGEFTSGEYVSGLTLSRAARLLSAGHGGQILLSAPTTELVREQLPAQTALREMGAHRLKDLVQPQEIFQALAKDLPQEFPALKTLDVLPNNLPIQLTSFVGRERELKELQEILSHERLVTLVGAGGSGKTRLAFQMAAEIIDEFQSGVWVVELASTADTTLVPNAIQNALSLRDEAGRTPLLVVEDYLRAKHLLLVLDNCEHLISACAEVAHHLLTHCPNLRITATSREDFGIAGEVIYKVPVLNLPDPKHLPEVESLAQYDALSLFIERARAVQPNFVITTANATAVAQICVGLDGIPLAIELAAARLKLFSPEQIAARLDDRLRLLTGGSRSAVPRQQTLRAAIGWSYSLLSDSERALFRRLSVFSGGWTFEAAEQVCAGNGLERVDVLELLAQLVNKSLVTTELHADETRYRMLETLREYAREKLVESGEHHQMIQNHFDFYLRLAQSTDSRLGGASEIAWLNHLESDFDNLRAALSWSLENTDPEPVLQLAVSLKGLWWTRSHFTEGRRWLKQALERSERAPDRIRAQALFDSGYLAYFQSDFEETFPPLEKALVLFRELGDKIYTARTLHILGMAAGDQGEPLRSIEIFAQGLKLAIEGGDRSVAAHLINSIGEANFGLGNLDTAEERFNTALAMFREVQDKWGTGLALGELGGLFLYRQEYARALTVLDGSLVIWREMEDKRMIGRTLSFLGAVACAEADNPRAKSLHVDALVYLRPLGDKWSLAQTFESLAPVLYKLGDSEKAVHLLGATEMLRETAHLPLLPTERAKYEADVAAIKKEWDVETFDKLWMEGRSLTLEQAIELALSEK